MLKIIAVAGGLAGAAGLSQYPEFSQQYTQRLAGQVDAITVVVADFEASALRAGLTRTQAFAQMTGTPFLQDRQADMRRTFARHAVLSDNLAILREASALQRLTMPQRLMDADTLTKTWGDFQPAVPLTVSGVVSGGAGFVGGWALMVALLALLGGALRRRPQAPRAKIQSRKEPALRRAPELSPTKPNMQPLVGRR